MVIPSPEALDGASILPRLYCCRAERIRARRGRRANLINGKEVIG